MTKQTDDPYEILRRMIRDYFAILFRRIARFSGGSLIGWNWHLDAIVCRLDWVGARDCRRLLVSLPPRNGERVAISVAWAARMLGRDGKGWEGNGDDADG